MKLKKTAALLLALLFLGGCTTEAPVEPTNTTALPNPAELPEAYGENDIDVLDRYAILVASPDDAAMQTPVAVNADGAACLTNADLQIYYYQQFFTFLSENSATIAQHMDVHTPLSEQLSFHNSYTWEKYFLHAALADFAQTHALAQAAYASGYVLSEEDEQYILNIDSPDSSFAEEYTAAGFSDLASYLTAFFGAGVDAKVYRRYLRDYFVANDYSRNLQAGLESAVTAADIAAYYDENAAAYEESGVLKCNNVTVRHILIRPEGEKSAEANDWTQSQWDAAKEEAQAIYDRFLANPSESFFAVLANENSDDDGSNKVGGLYESIAPGDMPFGDWCFEAAREAGDSTMVQSQVGWHIIYFVEQTAENAWEATARTDLLQAQMDEAIQALLEQYAIKIDYARIRLYDIIGAENAVG